MPIILESKKNAIMHTSSTTNIKHNDKILYNILNRVIKVKSGNDVDGYIAVATHIGNMTYDDFLDKIVEINKLSLQELKEFADIISDEEYVMSLVDTPLNKLSDMDFKYTDTSVDEIIVSKEVADVLSAMEIFPFSYIIKVTDTELAEHPEILENGNIITKDGIKYVMYRKLPSVGKEL